MIKYRPHRGSLEDAMAESMNFNYVADMLWYIERESQGAIKVGDITISQSYGEDERIGWKSWRYIKTVKMCGRDYSNGNHSGIVIGMCDLGELG